MRLALGQLTSRSLLVTAFLLLFTVALGAPAMAQLQGGTVYPINGTEAPPSSFATITSAVAYMQTNGVTGTGQVILELSSGYPGDTAPITIPVISGTSATLGVTFRPASGFTALTTIPGGASTQWAIRIIGNYITLDGQAGGTGGNRDWTIRCTGSGASGNGQSAVRVDNTSNSMTDVTVKYCVLEAESASTTSAIFGFAGGSGNTMKNIVIANNLIQSLGAGNTQCRAYGISVANATNTGNTGLDIRDNKINLTATNGIRITGGFPGIKVHGNEIYHSAAVTQASTDQYSGIYYSTTSCPGTLIYDNFIHDIQHTNAITAAHGIYLFNGNTSGNVNKVYNNRIAIGSGITPVIPVYGIRDNSVSNALFNVEYNSVYISGSPATGTTNSAGYRKEVNSATNLRNNILFNARSNSGTATGTHWGISINATTNLQSINYNDYFANGTGGVLGTTDGTATGNKTTLAAWKAAVTADVASVSQNPNYLNAGGSPPDLKIDTSIATQLESGGLVIAGIDNDFEGNIRYGSVGYGGTGVAPDIGADEFEGILLDLTPPTIAYAPLGNGAGILTRSLTNVTITDVSGVNGNLGTRPRVYYKKSTHANTWVDNTSATDGWKYVEANGGTSPFDFTIDYSLVFGGSVAQGDVIQYFVVAQDNAATPNVGINSGTFAAPPASVALTAAAFPIGGTINSYTIVLGLAGTKTVGTGGDYATLKAAFDDVNSKLLNGNLTLTVLSSGTTETASAVLNTVSYDGGPWTLTVKPDAGATPTVTGSIAGALVKLNGADNVVFDGSNTVGGTSRDLTFSNTSTAGASAALWVSSNGPNAGCTDNTIKNCVFRAGADPVSSTSETFGIIMNGSTISTSTGGTDNDRNTFRNNAIVKARWGMYLVGVSGNFNDNIVVTENLIGPAAFGSEQIGKGGIILSYLNNASVTRNEVRYVGCQFSDTASGTDRVGIGIGGNAWTPTSSGVTNTTVSRNLIHHVVEEKTFSAAGIIVAGSGAPSANTIANNMIYQVRANGTSGDQTVAIGIADGNGDKVVMNSIYLAGDLDPGSSTSSSTSSAAIRISSTTPSNLTLKDNIISGDMSSNTASLKHYTIVAPSASYAWGTGGCNNNDYYPNPANTQMVLGGIGTTSPYTDVATLAAWRTQFTPNQDAQSWNSNPPFVSATDLHLRTDVATPLESAGAPIAGVSDDYDGEARNVATPDIGADEGNFLQLVNNDIAAVAFIDPINGGSKSAGVPFSPQASFQNVGLLDQTNVPVRYRIVDSGMVEVYNDIQSVASLLANQAPTTVTFSSVTLNAGGTYTIYAKAELVGDQVSGNDEITGVLTVIAPLNGVYNVGAAEAPPFNTLTSAVASLNAAGISGSVTFNLVDATYTTPAETFPITINAYPGTNPAYTVTIKPANPGTTITGSSASAILALRDADYVVIDGSNNGTSSRDLTIENTSTSGATGAIWLASLAAGQGATHDVVKNCILKAGVDQSASTTETFGIIATGTTLGYATGGNDNDFNTFANNDISKVRWGIYLVGVTGNLNDSNVVAENIVGPAAFGSTQIGKGGIVLKYQTAASVTGNEVRYVGVTVSQTASGADRVGIGLGGDAWTPTSTPATNCVVARNTIHHVVDEKTFSAAGIIVAGSGTPSGNVVANNMIYEVRANGTAGDQTVGLGISDGNGDQVVFNSILLGGDLDPGSSTSSSVSSSGIRISSTTPSNLTLKNNIIQVDFSSNTATLKHYTIVAPATSYAWGTGGSNNNDYYPNPANTQMVLGGIGTSSPYTDVATLVAWQTQFTPNQDGASLNVSAPFVSATDLHLRTDVMTRLESAGTPIAAVTDDFDAQTRNASTPDVGADEGDFLALFENDVMAVAFVDPQNNGSKMTGTPFNPQASFQNNGSDPQVDVPVRYRIVDAGMVEVYNNTQVIASLGVNQPPTTVSFDSFTVNTAGIYTIYAKAELVGDQVPGNDEIVGQFTALAPLAGNYNVGAGQPAPFNTLTSAVGMLNNVGIADDVTFTLVDTLYTAPAETFPITINAYPGADTSRTVTIKPAAAGTKITGSSTGAILALNGADRVVVDGSIGRAASRDLTITNTNTSTASAVIWGATATGNNGAAHNVVKNCVVVGSGNTQTLIGIGFGGSTIGVTSNGSGNVGNRIENNSVQKTQYGIYSAGSAGAGKNTGTVIAGNAVNSVSPNNVTIGGIFVRFEDGVQVTNNSVGEVNRASGSNFGISLGFAAATNLMNVASGDTVVNGVVTGNKVASINSPSATGYSAVGIAVSPAVTGTTVIANNMVSGVTSQATPSDFTAGIYTRCGTGSTTRILFNSVAMTGSRGSATNPGFALAVAGTDPAVEIQNNILLNTQTATGGGKNYAIGLSYAGYTNLVSNYNDLYVAAAPLAVVGGFTNTPAGDKADLLAWQTETGKDPNSLSVDPLFVAANDLHISAPANGPVSPVANAGVAVAGFTTDFDGNTRLTTPDIGADEFATYTLTVAVSGQGTVAIVPDQPLYNPGSTVELTANADAGWFFTEWTGDATGNDNPLTVTMDADKNITAVFNRPDDVPMDAVPAVTFMGPNYPNPLSERTTFFYGLKTDGQVHLDIYDIQGRLVKRLVNDSGVMKGYKRVEWDGRNELGNRVGAGLYIARLRIDNQTFNKRVVVLP